MISNIGAMFAQLAQNAKKNKLLSQVKHVACGTHSTKALATTHFRDCCSPSKRCGIGPPKKLWLRKTTSAFSDEGIAPVEVRFQAREHLLILKQQDSLTSADTLQMP
eukprot:4776534-Amphidinium_carterae.1